MKKKLLTALFATMLAAASAVTAFADVAPEPDPNATRPLDTMITVLIVAVAIVAVAEIVWSIIRSRRRK